MPVHVPVPRCYTLELFMEGEIDSAVHALNEWSRGETSKFRAHLKGRVDSANNGSNQSAG